VLVAGSGRSGTSVFSGILQRFGFHVPLPEVPPDETNPRGFGESQWVVDFHTELLRRGRIQTADARPTAWSDAARVALDEQVRQRLSAWLEAEFAQSDHLLIKDPRLSWFISLWRRCGEELGAEPRFVTMLRHPAAVLRSKTYWYANTVPDASRAAGWLNQVLFTERATRDAPRVFIRYQQLLDDWAIATERVGRNLGLSVVTNAPATSMRTVAEFLDPSLNRTGATWDGLDVSHELRRRSMRAWNVVSRLPDRDDEEIRAELDEVRASYVEFYEEVLAIAQSSLWAASRSRGTSRAGAPRFIRVVPRGVRKLVPLRARKAVLRVLNPHRKR
jgi:hypothetical protein